MPSQINYKRFVISSLFRLNCSTIKLVLCCVFNLNNRTSSPPTSCQRLGLCSSTPSRSWWSWLLPALKNRPSVTTTWTKTKFKLKLYQHQLIKIKIFTFRDRLNGNNCCWQKGGRRWRKQHQGEVRRSGLSHWHYLNGTQDDLEPMIS